MTTLLRYQPWSVNPWFAHRNLFNRYFEAAGNADESSGATAEWTPAVDIEEYADKFVLYADVPGVDPKSIEVTLEKGVLTLSGNREKAAEAAGVEGRRIERSNGRFLRRFSLPDTVDGEGVTAKGSNGVLEIAIPKRPSSQPRKVPVSH